MRFHCKGQRWPFAPYSLPPVQVESGSVAISIGLRSHHQSLVTDTRVLRTPFSKRGLLINTGASAGIDGASDDSNELLGDSRWRTPLPLAKGDRGLLGPDIATRTLRRKDSPIARFGERSARDSAVGGARSLDRACFAHAVSHCIRWKIHICIISWIRVSWAALTSEVLPAFRINFVLRYT